MNQEEFLNRLNAITPADLHVYGESGRRRPSENFRTDNKIPKVYNTGNIGQLINVIQADHNETVIRFVIDKNGLPLFGEEGKVESLTPGHEEMSEGLCRTAGTFQFSDDYQTIVALNHESGFFKPQFSSLFWSLKYLFSPDSVFQLDSTLQVNFSVTEGLWQKLMLDTQALREVVENLCLKIADFSPNADTPYVTHAEEAPIVHIAANGIPCSGSYNDLIAPPVAQGLAAQIGMFAPANNIAGIAVAHDDDYGLMPDAFSDEEEDDLIFSPFKISRVS